MMKKMLLMVLIAYAAINSAAVHAQGFVDIESGVAFTGYNDVRIPNETGTLISLKNDIVSDPAFVLRVRAGYTFGGRHTVMALAAPLSAFGTSILERNIVYQGVAFLEGDTVSSSYRFDSFRLSYRYTFVDNDSLFFSAGLVGKLRVADIAIMGNAGYAHRSNIGFVPLLSAKLEANISGPFSVLLDVDALVTPFGRAEDALLAVQYEHSDRVTTRIGYRVLEGGSDGGGNVYTFALLHYATLGMSVRF